MTAPRHFDVHRLAVQFASDVQQLCQAFPRGTGTLRSQLRRSALAVALNLAEGLGRWKAGEKRAAYAVARGELLETRAALDVALGCGWITDAQHTSLEARADRIGAMLWKLVQRFRE